MNRTYNLKERQIPCRMRYKILSRDSYRCVLCGHSPANDPAVKLHIDHIIPLSKGGKSEEENLQTLCMECNLGKGDD
jgi:5-methylcytosine-specific restriction endonuclease McrA